VDEYTVAIEFGTQALAVALDGKFRGRVGAAVGNAQFPLHAADPNDAAPGRAGSAIAWLLELPLYYRLGQSSAGEKVDLHEFGIHGNVSIHKAGATADTTIIDEYMNDRYYRQRLRRQLLYGLRIGEIRGYDVDLQIGTADATVGGDLF
jgi:hypothetical protein